MTIDTRKLRYTGDAMAAFRSIDLDSRLQSHQDCEEGAHLNVNTSSKTAFSDRTWFESHGRDDPLPGDARPRSGRDIGRFPFTSILSPWVRNAFASYSPDKKVRELVGAFSSSFHGVLERERETRSGLHDLDVVELTYQLTLEIGAAVLLAADATEDPVKLESEFHSSEAAKDEHFSSWGRLLTGLECDPPIISLFPVYLMFCQSFTFEPDSAQEDYVYSALTGVDWAKGSSGFSDRLAAFERLARSAVPDLVDHRTGQDRSFWRIAHAYVGAMNDCENTRSFKTPRTAAIDHQLDHDLIIAMRALDTIGSAYMCSDGAAWLDDEGIGSLIGSGLANDVMDLHADIGTGETRNLLRLLYADGPSITEAMQSVSTVLSGELCEIFRGHHRARFGNREDGRVTATSPPYSFCRARHRRIFETMETYVARYPQFWEWTWEIFRLAKEQVTEAGLSEPLVCALKRSVTREPLPTSTVSRFYDAYYEMVEDGTEQLQKRRPLGVSDDLAEIVRDLHRLWHADLLADKEPGWGRELDIRSDMLFGDAGRILSDRGGISEDMYKFAIAYGRLSMALPYIAYHTIDAIILAYGVA